MGKSQIKSHCQISNHSVNRLKSLTAKSQIPFVPQISNLLATNLKSQIFTFRFKPDTFCLLTFHNIKKPKPRVYTGVVGRGLLS